MYFENYVNINFDAPLVANFKIFISILDLKSLKLGVHRRERVVVPVLKSEFLFEAAFKRMDPLTKITMQNLGIFLQLSVPPPKVVMNGMRVVLEWNQSGRQTVFK